MGADNDSVLEMFERWKKWAVAAFLLLAAIIALTALLLLEAGIVKRIWQIEFQAAQVHADSPKHGGVRFACPCCCCECRAPDRAAPH